MKWAMNASVLNCLLLWLHCARVHVFLHLIITIINNIEHKTHKCTWAARSQLPQCVGTACVLCLCYCQCMHCCLLVDVCYKQYKQAMTFQYARVAQFVVLSCYVPSMVITAAFRNKILSRCFTSTIIGKQHPPVTTNTITIAAEKSSSSSSSTRSNRSRVTTINVYNSNRKANNMYAARI